MRVLVVYSSQTENTRKLAEAVFATLTGDKQLYPVQDAPDPAGYDFVALGFWLQAGKPDPKSAEYLGKIGKKSLFLFAPEADIIGTYSCQGEVNPKVLEKAKSKPEPPVWIADAPNAVGHPDAADIEVLTYQISELLSNNTR